MPYNLRKRKNITYNDTPSRKRKTVNNDVPTKIIKKRKPEIIKKNINKEEIINYELWTELYECSTTNSSSSTYNNWVSASKTRNYLLNDSLADWLDLYYKSDNKNNESNMNLLFEKGNQFEQEVFDYIRKTYKDEVVMICKNRDDFADNSKSQLTEIEMKKGTPIILQAMVINPLNETFGVADMLVRSDYINKLTINESIPKETKQLKAPFLTGDYHYIVIDIKWSTIPLCANKKSILNTGSIVAYKGQLAIYNAAIGYMQGLIPSSTYILGKSWKCASQDEYGTNCFDLFGEINYEDFDNKYIEMTSKAVEWVRDVRRDGREWSYTKPHREEMYPNMCVQNNKWDSVKKDIAEKTKELTQIWMVGYKNRVFAHENNVYTIDDPNCSSKMMNINGKKTAPIIDKIIKINQNPKTIIVPKKIKNNTNNWKEESAVDFYIDFETFNKCFYDTNIDIKNSANSNVIFMKGIGYIDNNKFKYKCLILDSCNEESECNMLIEFKNFIEERVKIYMVNNNIKRRSSVTPKLFHWANAEKTFIDIANRKFNNILDKWLKSIQLVNLCKIFTTEPIIVKGMYNFKLKEVASAMYNNNMITTHWKSNTSNVGDGFTAMMNAVKYYKTNAVNSNNLDPIIENILDYNYVDCRVLYEITDYLRKNNT